MIEVFLPENRKLSVDCNGHLDMTGTDKVTT